MAASQQHLCDCQKSFKSPEDIQKHKDSKSVFICPLCCSEFAKRLTLDQHAQDKKHAIKGDAAKRRQTYVSNLYQQLNPAAGDKKQAMETVREIMTQIITHVRGQPGGKMYSADLRKAGSHAAKVKIGKADEYDWNVNLNVKIEGDVRTQGTLSYLYEDKLQASASETEGAPSPKNMNVDRKIKDTTTRHIPHGYASLKADPRSVPDSCLYKGDFIPHRLLKDLYDKINTALKEVKLPNKTGVDLSPISHGPAITLTIKPVGGHHISVDVTATLPCDLDVTSQGWPRADTRKALSADKIEKVKQAGIHLVPKGDEVWCVSYSKCEKALLHGIDTGNECRKMCHQIIKRFIQIFSSRCSTSGISSYIFKHQLFWMNEKQTKGPDYWKQNNFANCLLDMLTDTVKVLNGGRLNNYFDEKINILAGKDRRVLNKLAEFLLQEWDKIIHM